MTKKSLVLCTFLHCIHLFICIYQILQINQFDAISNSQKLPFSNAQPQLQPLFENRIRDNNKKKATNK